jgi:hypothetical protein
MVVRLSAMLRTEKGRGLGIYFVWDGKVKDFGMHQPRACCARFAAARPDRREGMVRQSGFKAGRWVMKWFAGDCVARPVLVLVLRAGKVVGAADANCDLRFAACDLR